LSNGTPYGCTVTARNTIGSGSPSKVLNVTPTALVDAIFQNGFE
jgi:hypothetical protein